MESLAGDDPAEIAGYRLGARLGAGGMGRVYLAFTAGGRPVALKIVRPELGDDPDFRTRFRHEVAAAKRVHGLYTAQVLDADPDASPPWLVTAYVPGPSLQQAVAGHGPLPADAVLLLMAGIAEALQGDSRGRSCAPRPKAVQRAAGRGRTSGDRLRDRPRG